MPSPHPAVTPEAIKIALKYGESVSKGIQNMEKCIRDYIDDDNYFKAFVASLKTEGKPK